MGTSGLEPPTSRLSGVRSNHLSYAPKLLLRNNPQVFLSSFLSLFCWSQNRKTWTECFWLIAVFTQLVVVLFITMNFGSLIMNRLSPMVEMRRIELLTPCLQSRCSPSWATPPFKGLLMLFSRYLFPDIFKIEQPSFPPLADRSLLKALTLSFLHRKEVIQPHLPIRLPCYDFTPVINPTFDCFLLAVRTQASGVTDSHGVTGGVYKARERIHRSMLICDY